MAAERIRLGGEEVTFRVGSEQTAGALVALEVEFHPGGGPALLHRHAPQEVYRVERGELAIYIEEQAGQVRRILSPAGAVVHIPAGRAHTVRNESSSVAFAYVVFTPGGEMERFVRTAARLGADSVPAADDLLALAGSHGIEMVGPTP